ncbi:MAG TPA: FxDxF family PEP-CTERM protein [Methylotenera sp.]|nr:FxDxF family PEP-CTERM protein [Methylotenera sp.]
MKSLLKVLLVSLGLFLSTTAPAATEEYGTLLSGSYQPAVPFASLDVTGSGSVYNFTLTAFDLNTIFTPGSFIGAIAVDINPNSSVAISNVTGGSPVGFSPGGGPTGAFEFRFDLTGPKQARLTSGESVSWTATFANPVSFTGEEFALHVQGLTQAQGGSAWYVNTSPVPEPETYGMMLSGLGILGFIARRKKKQS